LLQTDNHGSTSLQHSIFSLQIRCSYWHLADSVKALKANTPHQHLKNNPHIWCRWLQQKLSKCT